MGTQRNLPVDIHGLNQLQELAREMGQVQQFGVSSPLFTIMQEDGFLATITCAMTNQECCFSGFAFVDNTNLCISGQINATQTA